MGSSGGLRVGKDSSLAIAGPAPTPRPAAGEGVAMELEITVDGEVVAVEELEAACTGETSSVELAVVAGAVEAAITAVDIDAK